MQSTTATIASVRNADSAVTQALFRDVVARWRQSGMNIVGVIEDVGDAAKVTCNAGALRDIVTGVDYPIYLEAAPSNTSCRLDASGAANAAAAVLGRIADCDLVVLSKFGKLEAARQGLFDVFIAAVSAGKPVLTSVSEKHFAAWQSFAPGSALLPADTTAIERWRRSVLVGAG